MHSLAVKRGLLMRAFSHFDLRKLHRILVLNSTGANKPRRVFLNEIMRSGRVQCRLLHSTERGEMWEIYTDIDTGGMLPVQVELASGDDLSAIPKSCRRRFYN